MTMSEPQSPSAAPPSAAVPPAPPEPVPSAGTEDPSPPKRRLGWLIAVILLGFGFAAVATVLVLSLIRLDEANTRIEDQQEEIQEQQELIEKKETFSAAMGELVATLTRYDGTQFGSLLDATYHQSLAQRGWTHRWNADALDRDTAEVRQVTTELAERLANAEGEASTNASGTAYESTIDQLGRGFVSTAIDDADSLCESDVLGCVVSNDPFVVHFDAADIGLPYMTDWLRTGLAYHEFAHVLQMTNPEPTEAAAAAFGGDWETMADCYALTFLDGWTLDHQVWVSSFEYWEVSLGYGYTCDEAQRQVIRDWVAAVPFQSGPIVQE